MNPDAILLCVAVLIQVIASVRAVNELPVYAPAVTGRPPAQPFDAGFFPGRSAAWLSRQEWLGVLAWGSYAAVALRQIPGFDTPLDLTPAFGPITQTLVEGAHRLVVQLPDVTTLSLAVIALIRARASCAAEYRRQILQYEHNMRLGIGRGGAGLSAVKAKTPGSPAGRGRP